MIFSTRLVARLANYSPKVGNSKIFASSSTANQAAVDSPFPDCGKLGGWMVQALYLSLGRRHTYRAAVQAIEAPVQVNHRPDDLQTEAASYTDIEAFPKARFRVIMNGEHFAFLEQPEAFATVVGEFLAELK